MVERFNISGINTHLSSDLELYVNKKIGNLDKYVPKKSRQSLKVEVKLKETKTSNKEDFQCEVIMYLPHGIVTVHEQANSFLAAVDLVENRLKIQLKRYKEKHSGPRFHRRLVNRVMQK